MWIIVIIFVVIILLYLSTQSHKKEIEKVHLSNGGFRKSFPIFSNHIENFYEMGFVNDTGRTFSYSKQIKDINGNNGVLTIGVKLNMIDEPVIYSKFKSIYNGEYLGTDVSGVDFNSVEIIDECINISLDKIRTQGVIDYTNSKNGITSHSKNKTFLEDWSNINKQLSKNEVAGEIDIFINKFFIPDLINSQKFIENFNILQHSLHNLDEGYGTKSVRGIYYIPPAFHNFFIASYPDVYNWYQKNAPLGKVEIHNKIEKLSDDEAEIYFDNPLKLCELYRSLINQYKKEGNKLECAN